MKLKKIVAILVSLSMIIGMSVVSFSEPTEDFHTGPLPGQKNGDGPQGPEVAEYFNYVEDEKNYSPGSLLGDVDLSTVGRGLYYDGNDFYFFMDTGIMATNFMYSIQGDRFFFGEDGKMVKNQLVNFDDEIYYFDLNGAMYKNRWYSDEEIDEVDNTVSYTDYYFGPTGRAYRAATGGIGMVVKTIDGKKYGFNENGEKLEGYYDQNGVEQDPDDTAAYEDCVYYFDPEENGAAITGWHYYEGGIRGPEYDESEEIVLYFDEKTSRKVAARVTATEPNRSVSRIIDGHRYMFDNNGVRKNSWYVNEPGRASRSNLKYFNEEYDGYLQKGWFQAVPGAYSQHGADLVLDVNKVRHDNEEERWFYAGSNGNIFKKTIRKIGSYVYAFDDDGVMQEAAFVKVKNGSFVKAYQTDDVYRANILIDPNESGGNADPDSNGPANPINLDSSKGLLKASEGEQWMYFQGDEKGDGQVGAQAKTNTQVLVELNDSDISFMANSTGGYTNHARDDYGNEVTTVVERSGKYLQNGVLLRPDPDDNNYGIVRRYPATQEVDDNTILNYKNEFVKNVASKGPNGNGRFYRFEIVDSKGVPISGSNKSFKDKQGNYIYVGLGGHFIGYYPYQGRYYIQAPSNLVDENGEPVVRPSSPCWAYKDPDNKKWTYGLPPENERLDPSFMYINFNAKSIYGGGENFGPYEYGVAALVYDEND